VLTGRRLTSSYKQEKEKTNQYVFIRLKNPRQWPCVLMLDGIQQVKTTKENYNTFLKGYLISSQGSY
jgi:hypothetical protein